MRVKTGPGKVKTFPPSASALDAILAASLFNFDVDDATVKIEHRNLLDAKVVPPLKNNPQARVSLNGTTSRCGSAQHDRDLSAQRVNAVRDHLLSQGVNLAQISTTFTGKDLSTSVSNEDEAERAVFVLLTAQAQAGPARFTQANPADPLDGFHDGRPGFDRPVRTQLARDFSQVFIDAHPLESENP